MARIHVLDKHTAELIAAGEVVERPSSVVKELMENAIDAGASTVTVDIRNGGVKSLSVADNGCGIAREDVPVAFLRHATSKVRAESDLEAIGTLGFRGEALASISAVARVELLTRTAEETAGTRYRIEGGEEILCEEVGCPQGTTILVRDLFYNVPARMKFLKKDVSESNSVAGVVDRVALSHPEVSVRFLRDGKEELLTPGDGKLLSCIYTVFGRDFAAGMTPLEYTLGGVHVHGYVCKPTCGRANRTMQHFFINGRYVKTRTAMAALEEAYKGSMMVGKFPSCVLHIDLPLEAVDVNVHPAKIEVRFVNERPLFDAVYHGTKSALQAAAPAASMTLPVRTPPVSAPGGGGRAVPEQTRLYGAPPTAHAAVEQAARREMPDLPVPSAPPASSPSSPASPPDESQDPLSQRGNAPAGFGGASGRTALRSPASGGGLSFRDGGGSTYGRPLIVPDIVRTEGEGPASRAPSPLSAMERFLDEEPPAGAPVPSRPPEAPAAPPAEEEPAVRCLGEAFATYILAQRGDALYFIDKHAAHERILYDRLKAAERADAQLLLEPVAVSLSREEYAALLPELDTLAKAGFEAEDFGGHSVLVRTVPMLLTGGDVAALIQEIAGGLASGRREITTDKLDWIYHSSACRAAVKAGDFTSPEERQAVAERILLSDDIRTCPHGRPVCFELTRRELEKQFGRAK
ncbi:MAG TPA: DNA mismatch repair endonuclease MutL [Firmicutes bacterium]|nr:DNA mismatch repair endonuclease MutL [Bacillota bacterium]